MKEETSQERDSSQTMPKDEEINVEENMVSHVKNLEATM